METIQSRDNPLVKKIRALAHSGRDRRKLGQTVLDGAHLVDAARQGGYALREVLLSDSGAGRPEHLALIAALPDEVRQVCVPDALFRQLSPVESPSGLLAVIDLPETRRTLPTEGDVLLLDRVQDAGNLGTLLRSAAAAGVPVAVLTPGCAQAWSPRVLRAGMGAHFRLDIIESDDPVAWLERYRGAVYATTLGPGSRDLFETDLRASGVWLFGAEGAGVSPALLAHASHPLVIPMPGAIESLNVAAAAAIGLFEQLRQRRFTR
ncbi:RNA methyltransferase [Nitrogeniibacter mangrovi]|uniref:RNA methyltransferase n=1 Tax=Nitrogeniibacter mangrovi TaxID=2016596 RepID=A0A6C1B5P1_9RHOO|nr:RNA methyltransferase [Nitrogeniibacter mangrovi]QID18018.1 RNA methyltransferase [Nitrogeniibacter mangrovi]